jgi:hypothetical protein
LPDTFVSDSYLRLRPGEYPLHSNIPEVPGALAFIDVDVGPAAKPSAADLTWITKLIVAAPPGFFLQAAHVLIRWPATVPGATIGDFRSQAKALSDFITDRSARSVPVGIVRFPLAKDPEIVWSHASVVDRDDERRLLARARAAEFGYLLRSGRGIWRPKGYHYRLPSGEHSDTFVRVANAFQRPRDALALATWLHTYASDELAVVIDTFTVLPLVLGLHQAMVAGYYQPGDTINLDDYPANAYEVEHAVAAVRGAPSILGLLSVTSTGTTSHRMAEALSRAQLDYALETLVNRVAPTAGALPNGDDRSPRQAWLGLGIDTRTYASADQCGLCRDPDVARVVYIDPHNFEPLTLTRPDLLTPRVGSAQDNRALWEFYDAVDGVGVHARPHKSTIELRGNRDRLAIRCYPQWLLNPSRYIESTGANQDRFLSLVSDKVANATRRIAESERRAEPDPAKRFDPQRCDLIVTTEADGNEPGFSGFLAAFAKGLGRDDTWPNDRVLRIPRPYGTVPEEMRPAFIDSTHVMVLTLGAVTGTTMQQLLVAVHDEFGRHPRQAGSSEPLVGGLVLHARPEDEREWTVLHNAFTRLEALWRTPLSLWSPFEDERDLLAMAPEAATASSFFRARREFLGGTDTQWEARVQSSSVDPYAVFWGMPLRSGEPNQWAGRNFPRLRPGSRFGFRIRATTTFAAVGSAMQQARLEATPKAAPSWQQFEMPAILRSYFDPPIVASILRWLRPHEAWWGERPEDSANVIAEALARATDEDRKLLLPEILLAAALGKVPKQGIEWLRAEASSVLWAAGNNQALEERKAPWTEEEVEPVKLGLLLLGGQIDRPELVKRLEAVAKRIEDVAADLSAAAEEEGRRRELGTMRFLDLLTTSLPRIEFSDAPLTPSP